MATTLAPVDSREVLRCDSCHLVQFRTNCNECRRCHKSLDAPEERELKPILAPPVAVTPEHKSDDLLVATAIRCLRQRAGMSQRQLALRMQVPRTYVSKIENNKAMPTLSSLQRLANALMVDIGELLRGPEIVAEEKVRQMSADPFLAQMMPDLLSLDSIQRATLLGELRTMALRSRRSA